MQQMKQACMKWIGNVPKDWNYMPIRNILIERLGGHWGNDLEEESDSTICLRIADFDFNKGRFKKLKEENYTKRQYSELVKSKYKLRNGDILIEKSGGGEKTPVGRCVIFDLNQECVFANFMDRLRVNTKFADPRFVQYWLMGWYFCKSSPYYINQTTGLQNIDLTMMLAKEKIYYPTLLKQLNIIKYLDKKCGEIDGLISDIEKEIEVLTQYKKSIITETVTRGLDKNTKLKSTDIKWLPFLPEMWSYKKAKYLFVQRTTKGNKNLQLLSPTQKFGVIPQDLYEELSGMVAVKVNEKTDLGLFKTINKGDFCISLRSFEGGFEFSNYDGVVSPAYTVFYPKINCDRQYFKYLFKTQIFIDEMNSYSLSLRDGKPISFFNFGNTYIPLPSIQEQKEIAEYLDKKCKEIDAILEDKNKQLEILESYKKSIIYEYVTGKKEVK